MAGAVGMEDKADGLKKQANEAIDGLGDKGHEGVNTGQEAVHAALGDDDFEATYEDPDDAN
mgnify:CR=1 FL=1